MKNRKGTNLSLSFFFGARRIMKWKTRQYTIFLRQHSYSKISLESFFCDPRNLKNSSFLCLRKTINKAEL